MNTLRRAKSTYFASFLFGVVLAVLVLRPLKGAEPRTDMPTKHTENTE